MTISKENDPTKRFIFLNVLMQVGIGNPEPQLPAPWLKREMSEKLGVFAPFFLGFNQYRIYETFAQVMQKGGNLAILCFG